MPLSKEYQLLQELIEHPGWEIFKGILIGPGEINGIKCLKEQFNDKLLASARAGTDIESAKFAGQIDALPIILKAPEDVLNKAMSK